MYDFAKTLLSNIDVKTLISNHCLEFKQPYNNKTSELENRQIAKFNGLEYLIINSQIVLLKGSVHKFKNAGNHNYDDFTLNDFVDVLISLHIEFGINPYQTRLQNLEFGVNVEIPFKTEDFLSSIILYKNKLPDFKSYGNKGCLLRFVFDQYELKLYDKSKQYGLNENIIRIEVKVKKMEYFNSKTRSIGIYSLIDLLQPDKVEHLKQLLVSAFKEILFNDFTINPSLVKRKLDRELLINGRNPKYWQNFPKPRSKTYYRQIVRYRALVLRYGKENPQMRVLNLIIEKLDAITQINEELSKKINDSLPNEALKNVPILTHLN